MVVHNCIDQMLIIVKIKKRTDKIRLYYKGLVDMISLKIVSPSNIRQLP